jgi:hypothetical protein
LCKTTSECLLAQALAGRFTQQTPLQLIRASSNVPLFTGQADSLHGQDARRRTTCGFKLQHPTRFSYTLIACVIVDCVQVQQKTSVIVTCTRKHANDKRY